MAETPRQVDVETDRTSERSTVVASRATGPAITRPELLNAAVAEAFAAGDVDGFLALHTDDATTSSPPVGERVHGLDAIRAAVAPIMAMKPRLTSTVTKVLVGDDLALTHATWELSAIAPNGAPVEQRGRGTIVARRQDDGTWRIVLDDPLTPE
jgi:uncharacterized protein (TIGR02246 family)